MPTEAKRLFLMSAVAPLLAVALLSGTPAPAPAAPAERLAPARVDAPPAIDGVLDDAAWSGATAVSGFKTYAPSFGKDLPGSTEVFMAYDRDNLYFAFRCADPEPGQIKTSIASRDNMIADDWVCINLDSFNDQQALYAFYVNPSGIQGDSRFSGRSEDFSIDLVWDSAGRLTGDGYTVEVRLPLTSIRFSRGDPVRMGVVFERYLSRTSEHATFPVFDPGRLTDFLGQMRTLEYRGLARKTVFEILPAFTASERRAIDEGDLALEDRAADFGVTAKYGVTSDLVLDATVNPDFSQVEADAGQVDVNLRYDLFYSEKRPFFLEGADYFKLAAVGVTEIDPVRAAVHTRTIVDPVAGAKLSGKLGARNIVGSIYAADELFEDEAAVAGDYAHDAILRYKRTFGAASYAGAVYTGRETEAGGSRLGGIDGYARVGASGAIEFQGLLSRSEPGDGASAQTGHTAALLLRRETSAFDAALSAREVSESFDAALGYVTRTGLSTGAILLRPKWYPASGAVSRVDLELFSAQTLDRPSDLWETFNHASLQAFFGNNTTVKVKYSYATEIYLGERFETGGFHVLVGGRIAKQLDASVLYRRIGAIYYSADPYQGTSNRITSSLTWQPSSRLAGDASFIYYDFRRDADGAKIYDYPIGRARLTFQFNKHLFLRGIGEYNDYRRQFLADVLASFTYIPGTVVFLGYGSLHERVEWRDGEYVPADDYLETQRGLFCKISYLWRM